MSHSLLMHGGGENTECESEATDAWRGGNPECESESIDAWRG